MAETNNTTTTTSGSGATEAGRADNTKVVTKGGESTEGVGGNLSSANTPDAKLESTEPKTVVAEQGTLLPYPHSALAGITTEGSAYKDLIKEVYKEHEKELASDKPQEIELSDEMLAARQDAQVRLAEELRASLKAQRTMAMRKAQEGNITIKLTQPHIHGGVAYEAGDEIKVDEISANFIEDVKVGKRVDGSTKEDK
jgi:hypothetical protein